MIRTIKQVGLAIRKLRINADLTGEELGKRAGLSQSKISKIETGFYARLRYDDIKKILNILNASSTISQQVLRAVDESTQKNSSSITLLTKVELPSVELTAQARHVKVFTANILPPMVQTVEYKMAMLRCKGVEQTEYGAHIKNLLARQDTLWDGKHGHHMIMPQSSLYTLAGPKRDHLTQLDRIERVMSLPNVKLGIIPTRAGMPLVTHGSFALFDESILFVGLPDYEIESHEPLEIEIYSKIFEELGKLAFYDEDAVRLVREAVDYFI